MTNACSSRKIKTGTWLAFSSLLIICTPIKTNEAKSCTAKLFTLRREETIHMIVLAHIC